MSTRLNTRFRYSRISRTSQSSLMRLQQFVDAPTPPPDRPPIAIRSAPTSVHSAANAASRRPVRAPMRAARTPHLPHERPQHRQAAPPKDPAASRRRAAPRRSNATRTCEYVHAPIAEFSLQWRQHNALRIRRPIGLRCKCRARGHAVSPPRSTAAPPHRPAATPPRDVRARLPRWSRTRPRGPAAPSACRSVASVPPVAGSTASSGNSGNATPDRRSSISMMCSAAIASS